MPNRSVEEYEGRLNAHRELLTTILAILVRKDESLVRLLEQQMPVMDGEEDPGVIPTSAFATENARSEEVTAVLDAAIARSRRGTGGPAATPV